jgi:hypothetical protein
VLKALGLLPASAKNAATHCKNAWSSCCGGDNEGPQRSKNMPFSWMRSFITMVSIWRADLFSGHLFKERDFAKSGWKQNRMTGIHVLPSRATLEWFNHWVADIEHQTLRDATSDLRNKTKTQAELWGRPVSAGNLRTCQRDSNRRIQSNQAAQPACLEVRQHQVAAGHYRSS